MTKKEMKMQLIEGIKILEAVGRANKINVHDMVRSLNKRSSLIMFNLKYHATQKQSDRFTKAEMAQLAQDLLTVTQQLKKI